MEATGGSEAAGSPGQQEPGQEPEECGPALVLGFMPSREEGRVALSCDAGNL